MGGDRGGNQHQSHEEGGGVEHDLGQHNGERKGGRAKYGELSKGGENPKPERASSMSQITKSDRQVRRDTGKAVLSLKDAF